MSKLNTVLYVCDDLENPIPKAIITPQLIIETLTKDFIPDILKHLSLI